MKEQTKFALWQKNLEGHTQKFPCLIDDLLKEIALILPKLSRKTEETTSSSITHDAKINKKEISHLIRVQGLKDYANLP